MAEVVGQVMVMMIDGRAAEERVRIKPLAALLDSQRVTLECALGPDSSLDDAAGWLRCIALSAMHWARPRPSRSPASLCVATARISKRIDTHGGVTQNNQPPAIQGRFIWHAGIHSRMNRCRILMKRSIELRWLRARASAVAHYRRLAALLISVPRLAWRSATLAISSSVWRRT